MILIFLTTLHVVVSLFLIAVVLLQQGKGADLSVFGGGGTMTAFGARGAATVLHKMTVISFILFVVTTISIGLVRDAASRSSVMSGVSADDGTVVESAVGDDQAAGAEDGASTTEAEGTAAGDDGTASGDGGAGDGTDAGATAEDPPPPADGGAGAG